MQPTPIYFGHSIFYSRWWSDVLWWPRLSVSVCGAVCACLRASPSVCLPAGEFTYETTRPIPIFTFLGRVSPMAVFQNTNDGDTIRYEMKIRTAGRPLSLSANSHTYYYLVTTHSLFHSRYKTFLFCKSFPTAALHFFFLNIHYMDSPDCLLLFLSISVFYYLLFLFSTFFSFFGSVR